MKIFEDFNCWSKICSDEINEQIANIMEEAKKQVSEFYDFKVQFEKRNHLQPSQRSVMGVRVHEKDGYYTIEWFCQEYYKDDFGNWKALSKHIKRKGDYRYTEAALKKHAKSWELIEILELEKILAVYREAYANLMDVNRH